MKTLLLVLTQDQLMYPVPIMFLLALHQGMQTQLAIILSLVIRQVMSIQAGLPIPSSEKMPVASIQPVAAMHFSEMVQETTIPPAPAIHSSETSQALR